MTAAYRPVRELIQQERLKDLVTTKSLSNTSLFFCPFFLLLVGVDNVYFIFLFSITFYRKKRGEKKQARAQKMLQRQKKRIRRNK